MQTAQETGTFQRRRAEVPHEAVAIAPTPAEIDQLSGGLPDELPDGATAPGDEQATEQELEIDGLVARAKAGDQSSLEALLAAVRPRAMATAMKILRNADDADDAVQEAFVKIWRSFRRFEGRSAFSTWVHRIVMNASLDGLRRAGARHETQAGTDVQPEAVQEVEPANERTPESDLAELETQMLVRTAIARLPLLHRQAVELRELEDCSYQEMADIIHCPIGTVMSRLHHARHRLFEDLSQPFGNTFARAAA
jgi:RNA polymerase sigma-70 factor, ECF subfamily